MTVRACVGVDENDCDGATLNELLQLGLLAGALHMENTAATTTHGLSSTLCGCNIKPRPQQETMPNLNMAIAGFGGYDDAFRTVILFTALAILVVALYMMWGPKGPVCDTELVQNADGSLTLKPSGKVFSDLNAFQQWFHASGTVNVCPLPVLKDGTREVVVTEDTWGAEQMYARTPIYKVDDYEFSRIFGYERAGHMDVPRQNYNIILEQRTFDWADKPLSSDERRGKYAGLKEGFTAAGELESQTVVRDAAAQYRPSRPAKPDDIDCKMGREAREVAKLVAAAYENEPDWEPVVTRVGANHWEVNELRPRRRLATPTQAVNDAVVNTDNDAVDIAFRYREKEIQQAAIDPYFANTRTDNPDPFYGPVPGMERMIGPTFDRTHWY